MSTRRCLQTPASVQRKNLSFKGFSLVEVAIILLFISLAMVPIVNNMSGPGGSYGTGAAQRSGSGTRVIGSKHKEVTLANALMERLLSGDTSILNTPLNNAGTCTGGAIPALNSGATRTFNCMNNQYGENIYYQWIVTDRSREFIGNQASDTNTMGNDFYQVTLNMFDNPNWNAGGTIPIMTMPTIAFRNTQSPTQPSNVTGIVMVLDISGSMAGGGIDENGNDIGVNKTLPYRYNDPAGYTAPANIRLADLFNNATLDIVAAQAADDPLTPFDDRYPSNGVPWMGITNCGVRTDPVFGNQGIQDPSRPVGHSNNPATGSWYRVCNRLDNTSNPYRNIGGANPRVIGFTDENLSRIEAARSSLLRFLLTIEEDPTLRSNIRLGFVTYEGNNIRPQVPNTVSGSMESANADGNYEQMRRRLSWLNRTGNGSLSLVVGGTTPTWNAVAEGARMLYNQDLNGRAIFLVTDGRPNSSNACDTNPGNPGQATASGNCFRTRNINTSFGRVNGLGNSLANGTFPGADGETVTVYGLGLMEEENIIRPVIEEGLTAPTHGDFQYTQSVGEMDAVFENMKYAILKEIIKSNAGRYGIDYD